MTQDLSLLEEVKLQAQVLVPVLKARRACTAASASRRAARRGNASMPSGPISGPASATPSIATC
jgi:hypothetical protein